MIMNYCKKVKLTVDVFDGMQLVTTNKLQKGSTNKKASMHKIGKENVQLIRRKDFQITLSYI